MKNWKIGIRIAAGFSAVILIAVTLGLFAYLKVGDISKNATAAITKDVPKLYLVGVVKENVEAIYSLGLRHAVTANKQEKGELDVEILSGLAQGETIIMGPLQALRELKGGEKVHFDPKARDIKKDDKS